jgi:hypothetical protein
VTLTVPVDGGFADAQAATARRSSNSLRAVSATADNYVMPRAPIVLDPGLPWVEDFADCANRLLRLPPNWDSYGASPLNAGAVYAAYTLLCNAAYRGALPHMAPTPSGDIHLEWEGLRPGDVDVSIDIDGFAHVYVMVSRVDDDDIDHWSTVVGDLRLQDLLEHLSASS